MRARRRREAGDGLAVIRQHDLSAFANLIEQARELPSQVAEFNASHHRLRWNGIAAELSRRALPAPRAQIPRPGLRSISVVV
jgi:hypothetical protein